MVEINGQVMRMGSTAFRKFRDYAGGDGFVAAMRELTYPGSSLSLRARRAANPERSRMGNTQTVTRSAKRRTARLSCVQTCGDRQLDHHPATEQV